MPKPNPNSSDLPQDQRELNAAKIYARALLLLPSTHASYLIIQLSTHILHISLLKHVIFLEKKEHENK